jgi:hypothetical protein
MRKELRKDDALRFYALMTMGGNLSIDACINTAYRDFCRTMHGIMGNDRNEAMRSEASDIIKRNIGKVLKASLTQAEFDKLHGSACKAIKIVYSENQTAFYIGQSQKWINMSFKYVYLLYLADLLDIGKTGSEMLKQNYRYFHLPIDNIVLQHHTVKSLYSEHIGNTAWSRIDDYSKYLAFQKILSEAVEIPLIVFESQIWK